MTLQRGLPSGPHTPHGLILGTGSCTLFRRGARTTQVSAQPSPRSLVVCSLLAAAVNPTIWTTAHTTQVPFLFSFLESPSMHFLIVSARVVCATGLAVFGGLQPRVASSRRFMGCLRASFKSWKRRCARSCVCARWWQEICLRRRRGRLQHSF